MFQVGDWGYIWDYSQTNNSMWLLELPTSCPLVSYKLALHVGPVIHPVFHVSCLKAKLGLQIVPISTFCDSQAILSHEPVAVLQTRSHRLRRKTISGKAVLLMMLLRRTYSLFSNNIHILWARCFDGEGNVRSLAWLWSKVIDSMWCTESRGEYCMFKIPTS